MCSADPVSMGRRRGAPVPADFRDVAGKLRNKPLMERYGVTLAVITRWRDETGIRPPKTQAPINAPEPVPAGFRLVAPTSTRKQLRTRYGKSEPTINRWLRETGITPRTAAQQGFVGPAVRTFNPANRPHRDASRAGGAADFLRRFGPVVRCDATGRFDPNGDHWRRGASILTADEVIQRAERNGWNPDAWRLVA